jgi:hypothetical protein
MRGMHFKQTAALAAVCISVLAPARASAASIPGICLGDLSAAGVQAQPGALLRFGITPAGEAGTLGPVSPAVPGSEAHDLAALEGLRPPGGAPFVIRLNRFFWSDGEEGIARFERLARMYTSHGYEVELQVRYHPGPTQVGQIAEWNAFVREVVRRFGAIPGVVALQVTNEVNFTISPDSSDGSYPGAKDALIYGVEAAHDEAGRLGYSQLQIGFNWAYRLDPFTEASFWNYLRDHGGPEFIKAVDWVGLDAYPGTVFPPIELHGGYRDGMVNAMSSLRDCFMPIAGLGAGIPIHVEENGFPTGIPLLKSDEEQLVALREMTGAVDEFRGTYNVSDYRWFDLRDHDTSSPNFQHHYGLMEDGYQPKPAYAAYGDLVRSRSRPGAPAPAAAPRARHRRKGCRKKRRRKASAARKRCVRKRPSHRRHSR